MTVRILIGDVREKLGAMEAESVDCVVTSPPYWGLRDYGVAGQIGLEPTLGEHLDVMVEVFDLVRRVMKPTATLWLNYGDCYATQPNGRSAADTKAAGNDDRTFRDKPFSTIGPIRSGAPLRAGRSNNKGNMASDGVRRSAAGLIGGKRITAGEQRDDVDVGGWGARDDGLRWRGGGLLKPKDLCMIPNRIAIALQDAGWWVRSEIIWHKPNPMPESTTDRPTSSHEKLWLLSKAQRYFYDADAIREPQDTLGERHEGKSGYREDHPSKGGIKERTLHPLGRNKRNVWTVPTAPFSEAHFATFPPALIEPCIKAGCPVGGVVLDPFGGSGTTGMVADRLGRDAILIELNPEYAAIAERRIRGDAPMFAQVAAE